MLGNVINGWRRVFERSLPLKFIFWSLLTCFSLAITLSLIYPAVDCGIYGIPLPCSHYFVEDINQCSIGRSQYCCGSTGSIACGSYSFCQDKPTPFDIPKCAGLLISAWILDAITLALAIAFFILFRRLRDADAGFYQNLDDNNIEIPHENNIHNAQPIRAANP